MLPIVLALLAAFFFAFGNVVIRRGLSGMDHFTGLLINLISNAVLLWGYLLVFADRIDLWVSANLLFAGVGLLVPSVSRLCMITGIQRLGASVATITVSSGPLFAIAFAVPFLRERPTAVNLLGALAIAAGVVFLAGGSQTRTWRPRDLIFPLTAAFLFAVRDNLVRFGLLITRAPVLGATIASTVSALTIGTAYAARPARPRWGGATRAGFLWFLASGFLNFLAYLGMYTALALDRISVVVPIVNGYSVFVLPLTFLMLKDIERITARKIVATALVLLGLLLISWEKLF